MKSKSLSALKKLLAQRAAVGKQILATEKKLIAEAEALEKKAAAKPAAKKAKAKTKKAKAKKPAH